jgi:hypothetical protein
MADVVAGAESAHGADVVANGTDVRFVAITDSTYLSRTLVLAESLRGARPGATLDVLCMDTGAQELVDGEALDGVSAIGIHELEGYDPALTAVKHERTLAEYCWTVKPSLCRFAFDRHPGAETVVYVDADLMFFADPSLLLAELDGGSGLLVPHRAPPSEYWEAALGTYNAGFLALRRVDDAFAALAWWRARCLEWCFNRVEPGRYCDQKYLDDWPRLFEGVRSLTHLGGGLAPWNASGHRLSSSGGRVWVDDVPLVFFHYQSLELHRGVAARLCRLGMLPTRFRCVPDDELAWSIFASYDVSAEAERLVYAPYARRLAAAAEALARSDGTVRGTFARLAARDVARGVARALAPRPVRHAVRRARSRSRARAGESRLLE